MYEGGKWVGKATKGMYDAIMVPLSEFADKHHILKDRSAQIVQKTIELFAQEGVAAVTGRASTKRDLENRIDLFRQIFRSQVEGTDV